MHFTSVQELKSSHSPNLLFRTLDSKTKLRLVLHYKEYISQHHHSYCEADKKFFKILWEVSITITICIIFQPKNRKKNLNLISKENTSKKKNFKPIFFGKSENPFDSTLIDKIHSFLNFTKAFQKDAFFQASGVIWSAIGPFL